MAERALPSTRRQLMAADMRQLADILEQGDQPESIPAAAHPAANRAATMAWAQVLRALSMWAPPQDEAA